MQKEISEQCGCMLGQYCVHVKEGKSTVAKKDNPAPVHKRKRVTGPWTNHSRHSTSTEGFEFIESTVVSKFKDETALYSVLLGSACNGLQWYVPLIGLNITRGASTNQRIGKQIKLEHIAGRWHSACVKNNRGYRMRTLVLLDRTGECLKDPVIPGNPRELSDRFKTAFNIGGSASPEAFLDVVNLPSVVILHDHMGMAMEGGSQYFDQAGYFDIPIQRTINYGIDDDLYPAGANLLIMFICAQAENTGDLNAFDYRAHYRLYFSDK